uniref:Aminoglycoside phosphotransferase domain-containing protein n=1 Tax=Coccidioides posadasii RMSCC 3488 TaxID=454284 RepID=A0A0J6FG84_COCPO|nr:hypothetical protein CPAG_05617 [Coccidioides posadasii RMSCC 3488]
MLRTQRLQRREITYASAKEEEVNVLHQMGYYDQQTKFFAHLNNHRDQIKDIVARHLGLSSPAVCHVAEENDWLHGSLNACIPVTIVGPFGIRVMIRFPLPYRIGEDFGPGNANEKIRCEAGTYASLQENCLDIPIPRLYGFALSDGETLENLPPLIQWIQRFKRRFISWLGHPIPSKNIRSQRRSDNIIGTGYLLMEYIEPSRGTMLSNTWMDSQHDMQLSTNLFRDPSRIFLSLIRVPRPRIGSFIIDDHKGFLVLAYRPLSVEIQLLENGRMLTDIHRDYTYSTVDSYLTDILTFHVHRFRYQPNALSFLTGMRAVFKILFQANLRRGPFILTFTDMHQSNIFVDKDSNITCLVDLERACSRPIEMSNPPHWLTHKGVDELVLSDYDAVQTEFMGIMTAKEKRQHPTAVERDNSKELRQILPAVMNNSWATGTFWYTLALSSPSGLFGTFKEHIRPLFCRDYIEEFNLVMLFLWKGMWNTSQAANSRIKNSTTKSSDAD